MILSALCLYDTKDSCAAEETSTSYNELKGILKDLDNLFTYPDKNQSVLVRTIRRKSPLDLSKIYIGELADLYKDLKYSEPFLGDGLDEQPYILLTLSDNTLRIYLITNDIQYNVLKPVFTIKNVKEIRKSFSYRSNSLSLLIKRIKGRNTSYIEYDFKGVIKKAHVYTHKGKSFKKDSKRISAKKFNQFKKKYKKCTKCSLKKATAKKTEMDESEFYYLDSVTYSSKDLSWEGYSWNNTECKPNLVMLYNKSDKSNPYQFFSVDKSDMTRYVLGPNVIDPKTNKTYLEQNWLRYKADWWNLRIVSDRYSDMAVTGRIDEGHSLVLESVLTGLERELSNGSRISVKQFCLKNDEIGIRIIFDVFENGSFRNRIHQMIVYVNNELSPLLRQEYEYDSVHDDLCVDDSVIKQCYPETNTNLSTRSLIIGYEGSVDSFKEWIIKTSSNVRIEFPYLFNMNNEEDEFYIKIDGNNVPVARIQRDDDYENYRLSDRMNIMKNGSYHVDDSIVDKIFWRECEG